VLCVVCCVLCFVRECCVLCVCVVCVIKNVGKRELDLCPLDTLKSKYLLTVEQSNVPIYLLCVSRAG